jgi:hypothetical protein
VSLDGPNKIQNVELFSIKRESFDEGESQALMNFKAGNFPQSEIAIGEGLGGLESASGDDSRVVDVDDNIRKDRFVGDNDLEVVERSPFSPEQDDWLDRANAGKKGNDALIHIENVSEMDIGVRGKKLGMHNCKSSVEISPVRRNVAFAEEDSSPEQEKSSEKKLAYKNRRAKDQRALIGGQFGSQGVSNFEQDSRTKHVGITRTNNVSPRGRPSPATNCGTKSVRSPNNPKSLLRTRTCGNTQNLLAKTQTFDNIEPNFKDQSLCLSSIIQPFNVRFGESI